MALTDLMLKAKVNLALARDPRISPFDVGIHVEDGRVLLNGDVDTPEKRRAAEDVARAVEGVRTVVNNIAAGTEAGKMVTAEMVSERFLAKLDEEWKGLPDSSALAQADYVKWALWMIYKFQIPESGTADEVAITQARATEDAIRSVANHVGASPALIALELQRVALEADPLYTTDGPNLRHADLVTSSRVDEGNTELAA